MARILFTAINYWPEPSGTAPYTTALAEHLVSRGHRVTVLTGLPHYPSWRISPTYRVMRKEEWVNGVRVVRRAHYVPSRQSALSRAAYEASFFVHGLTAIRMAKPDAIVGVIPSLNGGLLARAFSARYQAPYGLIVQDLMGAAASQTGIAGGRRVAGATRRIEQALARGAAAVGAISEGFSAYLLEAGVSPDCLVQLPNWSRINGPGADRIGTRRRLGWRDDETIVLHAGNIGLKQGLEQVIAAAELTRDRAPNVRFAFVGDGSQRRKLHERTRHMANVTFHGLEPEETFADSLAAADVLLVSERPAVTDMSLPSKLTSYFAAGRPIVAAVMPGGATGREIERSGAGVVVPAGEREALLASICRLAADGARAAELGAAGVAYARTALEPEAALGRAARFVDRLVSDGRDR